MRSAPGHRQPSVVARLTSHGAAEGADWGIGDSPIDWHGRPCVIELGPAIGVHTDLRPVDPHALPVLVRSSAVRLLGGRRVADMMDAGEFPGGDAVRAGALRAGRELTGGRP